MRRRIAWGYSSAGRALEWHSRGQRFDPAYLHHPNGRGFRLSRFFLFMPRFARCIRRRTRRQRLPAPVPPSPAAAGILYASVGMGVQRTAGDARRAVRPPSFPSPCGSSIPPAAVTPHAAKKFARRQRPFSRRYSLRAPLDDNHGSRKPDGENAGAQTSGRRDTAQRTLSRADNSRRTALPNARPLERTPRQNGHTQAACQKRIRLPAKHIKP